MPNIYDDEYQYEIGKASVVMDGEDGEFILSGDSCEICY